MFVVIGLRSIDALVEFAKGFGAKGLAYIAIAEDGTYKSSFAKFMTEDELHALVEAMEGKPGDLLLFAADRDKVVFDVLGNLRLELAKQQDLLKKDDFKFLWVTEFPLLEYSEEQGRFVAMHHPFTMPMDEDWHLIDSDRSTETLRPHPRNVSFPDRYNLCACGPAGPETPVLPFLNHGF